MALAWKDDQPAVGWTKQDLERFVNRWDQMKAAAKQSGATGKKAKTELDRLCDALILIRAEIQDIADGRQPRTNNLLKNAPHTASVVTATEWNRPYSREQAAFPAPWVRNNKFWPSVSRIDEAYGDRNLVCSCPPIESYQS
jgi:glycine dehydrogenase